MQREGACTAAAEEAQHRRGSQQQLGGLVCQAGGGDSLLGWIAGHAFYVLISAAAAPLKGGRGLAQ